MARQANKRWICNLFGYTHINCQPHSARTYTVNRSPPPMLRAHLHAFRWETCRCIIIEAIIVYRVLCATHSRANAPTTLRPRASYQTSNTPTRSPLTSCAPSTSASTAARFHIICCPFAHLYARFSCLPLLLFTAIYHRKLNCSSLSNG